MPTKKATFEIVKPIIEEALDQAFTDLHGKFNTKSGDITPEQQLELDKLTDQLSKLMVEQINQNL